MALPFSVQPSPSTPRRYSNKLIRPSLLTSQACMNCFMTCMRPIFRLITHCCCFPSSYFCDRNRSSLLLLGSMFFYSIARAAELAANTIDYGGTNQGAATLYQTVVTAVPAICLVLLQVCFNLKWVTNVRNISASGAPEGSRLSLGPSRSALSLLPLTRCLLSRRDRIVYDVAPRRRLASRGLRV